MEIKLENVTYKSLFENLSLTFKSGAISTIVGTNCSGKTSLMDIIYMLKNDFDGIIKIGNNKIKKNMDKKSINRIRQNMFYITQKYENQFLGTDILSDLKYLSGKEDNEIYNLINEFDLDASILNKNYSCLSYGQLKKIIIIAMIISGSKILILDDPTIGLDSRGKQTLIKWLKKLRKENKTIIVSSSDESFLLSISDSVFLINNLTKNVTIFENKYYFFENKVNTSKANLSIPNILEFRNLVLSEKNKKLMYRDNINDLIKDIYRNV